MVVAGLAALLVIALIDRWLAAEPHGLLATGVADETAHLLTAALLLAAVPIALPVRFVAGALVGSVAIDLDHLPLILGSDLLTAGTNRPLTHCLLMIICAAALAFMLPAPWRWTLLGIAAGFAAHFWRDLATSTAGVPLLWPVEQYGFRLPYSVYMGALIGFVVIATLINQQRTQKGPGLR